jgi:TetR/AcrR family transcriptional regulator, tetracycline repressor protein
MNTARGFGRWGRGGDRPSLGHAELRLRHHSRLDPETVVRAALGVLDEHGLDGLSIRVIAERLGVRGPALYWHFRNKQALLDAMAEAMLAARAGYLRPPLEGEPWWEWLAGTAQWLRAALRSRRDGARVFAGTTLPAETTFLRMLDLVVGVLHGAGFSWVDALRAGIGVYLYVIGSTIEEQSMPPPEVVAELEGQFPDPAAFPSLARAFENFELEADTGFQHGLDLILSGLRASLATQK